jgi:antitoxin ParD1/3/4
LTIADIVEYADLMNVSLTRELERLVNEKVKSGLYHTASEVIRDALRLLEERDHLYRARLEELRRDVRKGLDQLDRGEGIPFDPEALKRRVRHEVEKRKRRRAA